MNEKRNIMPGAYHQFLLATLDRDAASSNIKKIHHADDIDNNSKKVKTSSNTTCYVTLLRKLKKAQFVDTCHLIHNFLDNSLDDGRLALCRRIKKLFRALNKNVKAPSYFHNFCTDMPLPSNPSIAYYLEKVYLKGHYYPLCEENFNSSNPIHFLVLSFAGKKFLHGMVRRIIGVVIAIIRGGFDTSIIKTLMDKSFILDLKPLAAPGEFQLVTECCYRYYEIKYSHHLQPTAWESLWNKELSPPMAEETFNYRSNLLEKLSKLWMKNMHLLNEWMSQIDMFIPKLRQSLKMHYDNNNNTSNDNVMTTIPPSQTLKVSAPEYINIYMKVLSLLRDIHESGRWPDSSTGRRMLILDMDEEKKEDDDNNPSGGIIKEGVEEILQETKKKKSDGGSFSLGGMPAPMNEPHNNRIFPKLLKAVFELEKILMPNRPPSSTVAVNCNAQFIPHRDSGAGAGQLQSMIVGLGDYIGGELVVESELHDIRYKPIEFNGWLQRHWTLPFQGERFSLVWFTPKGCEDIKCSGIEIAKKYEKKCV